MKSCRNCARGIKLVLLKDVHEIVETGKAKISIFCMLTEEMTPPCAWDEECIGWIDEDD